MPYLFAARDPGLEGEGRKNIIISGFREVGWHLCHLSFISISDLEYCEGVVLENIKEYDSIPSLWDWDILIRDTVSDNEWFKIFNDRHKMHCDRNFAKVLTIPMFNSVIDKFEATLDTLQAQDSTRIIEAHKLCDQYRKTSNMVSENGGGFNRLLYMLILCHARAYRVQDTFFFELDPMGNDPLGLFDLLEDII